MILNISKIDKKTKITVLAIHFLLLATSAVVAQSYGQQLDDYFALNNRIIENLHRQLQFAITVCIIMASLTLFTIVFFVFEHKIFIWAYNASNWIRIKKIWLKNKWPF